MKRLFCLLAVAAIFFAAGTDAFAFGEKTEIEPKWGPLRKLQRGFFNVTCSPFELSHELATQEKEGTFPPSWFTGIGRGVFYMLGRIGVGAYEIVTFPICYPDCFVPIIYPEFPWELAHPEVERSRPTAEYLKRDLSVAVETNDTLKSVYEI